MERAGKTMLLKWLAVFLIVIVATNLANYLLFSAGSDLDGSTGEEPKTIIRYEPRVHRFEAEAAMIFEALDAIDNYYFYPVDIEELVEGAIRGMIDSIDDPQVRFYDPLEVEEFLLETRGTYGGIGIRVIEADPDIVVFEVFSDSPAERSGLNPGDRILEADGTELTGEGLNRAVELLRGPPDTSVMIKIQRPGAEDPIEFNLAREEISVTTVTGEMLKDGLGYIKINSFRSNTADDFKESLMEMEQKGLNKGLILDLRNNPGGDFYQAIEIGKLLVPEGEIARRVGRDDQVIEVYYSSAGSKPYPILVLINEESASASELLAGALQDREVAFLVGQNTFGKATVQQPVSLADGSAILLTGSIYFTPSGQNIGKYGIEPDFEVDMPKILHYYRYFHPGPLELGDFGAEVEMLQEILKQLGYMEQSTGYFDDITLKAIAGFQQDVGIYPSGKFDDLTWVKMREALDITAREQDKQLNYALDLLGNSDLRNEVGGND